MRSASHVPEDERLRKGISLTIEILILMGEWVLDRLQVREDVDMGQVGAQFTLDPLHQIMPLLDRPATRHQDVEGDE